MPGHTFKKIERIAATKDIDLLFDTGQSFKSFPLRVLYIIKSPGLKSTRPSVLISVSKKRFKRAVDRNKIKRLTREAYRLNRAVLIDPFIAINFELLIAFIYIGEGICSFEEIDNAMKKALVILKGKVL